MAVTSINLVQMAALVGAVERASGDLLEQRSLVSAQLSDVYLPTSSLNPVDDIVGWVDDELVGLRRRLAMAQALEASEPGISTVTFDDALLSTLTPEEAAARAEEVAASLLEHGEEDIPEDVLQVLVDNAADPYLAAALARAMPPGELAVFLDQRVGQKVGYDASGMSDSEEALHWAEQQRALTEALGEAYGLATTNRGDLALPSEWLVEWRDTLTDESFEGRTNPSQLTLLMRYGRWDTGIIVDTVLSLEQRDWSGDVEHNTVHGPEYWLELVGSSSSYEGAMIPNDFGGYDSAHDPYESLMFALANNPDAAVELFAMPGGDFAELEVDGQTQTINTYLHYFLMERQWHDDGADALVAAIEAAVMPRDGGSTDSALVAADLQVVLDYAEEQEAIAEANEPPLWSRIVHGVLDVLGFIPVVEWVADPLNAGLYFVEGDQVNAGLSLAGMIPVIGYAAVGGRWVKVTRMLDRAELDELAAAGRIAPVDGSDFARLAEGTDLAPLSRFLDGVDIPADAVRVTSGSTGDWNRVLNNPLPNQTYVVDGRFVYRTDAHGRVVAADGHLDALPGGGRNTYQQRVSGRGDRQPGDQGGHLFGTWFGGPGEGINIIPMTSRVNLSEYKALEGRWAELVAEGKTIDVQITPRYRGDSTRPDRFTVSWRVDGVQIDDPITFRN